MKNFFPWIIIGLLLIVVGIGGYYWLNRAKVEVVSSEDEELELIRPLDMRISDIESHSFTVEWETKGEVTGYVKYGDTSTALPLMAQDIKGVEPRTTHKVVVDDLRPGRKYYFLVVSDGIMFGKDNRKLEVLTLSQ
jgi:hypothetical protein